jgi:hypothetical protein
MILASVSCRGMKQLDAARALGQEVAWAKQYERAKLA